MDFTIPVKHSVKIKESKKIDKYLDIGREQKKLQWQWYQRSEMCVRKWIIQGDIAYYIRCRCLFYLWHW